MRLNRFIAKSGLCSRRKADTFIKEGEVTIGGKKVFESFIDVSDTDTVKVRGKIIQIKDLKYLLLNKPKGVTTTLSDKFASSKVSDLLPKKFGRLYPVGRLDKDSSGLVLLTNDGDLCYQLTHPKYQVEKEYLIELDKPLSPADCRKAKKGLRDEGDLLLVKDINSLKNLTCRVIVCEGKKRHLRRLFKALGFKVKELKRVRVGNLRLGKLASGKYEVMSREEIYALTLETPVTHK